MHSARSQSASLFGLTLNNLVGVVSGTPGLGWLLPLGSHKVMGSLVGYIRSASELSKSFGFFSTSLFSSAVAISWIAFCWTPSFFSTSEDLGEFSLHILLNFSSASRLPGCHFFFVAAFSTLLDTRRLFLVWLTRSGFFRCLKKTYDGWRSLIMFSTPEDIVLDIHTENHA